MTDRRDIELFNDGNILNEKIEFKPTTNNFLGSTITPETNALRASVLDSEADFISEICESEEVKHKNLMRSESKSISINVS